METTTKKEEKTEFQGAVSLEAILAAKSGQTVQTEPPTTPATTTKVEEPKVEEPKEKEGEEGAAAATPATPAAATEPKKEETPPAQPQTPAAPAQETEAFKTAKRLIDLGLLEDFSIQTSDEDTEGTPISEFVGMTDDNLKEIVKLHKQEQQKELSSNYLAKGDLKEHQLKVFEILSNGGDLSQIAETPEKAMERPFEGFDMENQQRQIDVLYTDLVHGKGLDHESALVLVKKEVESGKIEETAKSIFNAYRTAHEQYIDKILADQKKEKEFKDLNFKENKKALLAKLKESGLKESVYKKVAAEYGKKNENGEYALVDKLRTVLESPEENFELIFHLANPELFNETFKIKAAQQTSKTIVRLASGAQTKSTRKKQETQPTAGTDSAPWLKAAEAYNEQVKKD